MFPPGKRPHHHQQGRRTDGQRHDQRRWTVARKPQREAVAFVGSRRGVGVRAAVHASSGPTAFLRAQSRSLSMNPGFACVVELYLYKSRHATRGTDGVCVGVRCGRHVCGPAPGQAVAGRVGCVGYSVPCTVGACLPRCLRAFPPARPPRHTPPPEYSVRSARVLGTALSIVSLPFSPRATRRHASELCLALDSASHMAHAPCDARPHMHSTFTCTRLSSSTGRD